MSEVENLLQQIKKLESEKEEKILTDLKKALKNPERFDIILNAYKTHLKRNPSIPEIKHHLFTHVPDKDVEDLISKSEEAKNIKKRAAQGGVSYDFIMDAFAIGETPNSEQAVNLSKIFNYFISLNDIEPSYLTVCPNKTHISFAEKPLSSTKIVTACSLLHEQISKNNKVYLQDEVGGVKSAIVAMFYLSSKKSMTFEKSQELIKSKRSLCRIDINLLTIDSITEIYRRMF